MQEVWTALKNLKLLSTLPRVTRMLLSISPNLLLASMMYLEL